MSSSSSSSVSSSATFSFVTTTAISSSTAPAMAPANATSTLSAAISNVATNALKQMKGVDPKVRETTLEARHIAEICLSQPFGNALYKVTTSASPESECPTIPNQNGLTNALKTIQAAKHIALDFVGDPASTDMEKTVALKILWATSLLQRLGYDLKQPNSYLRAAIPLDQENSPIATIGTGLTQLGNGLESLLAGVSQLSGSDQNVYGSFDRALKRESSESASLAFSSSCAATSIISTSTTAPTITVKQEAPAFQPQKHKLETDDTKEDTSLGQKPRKRGKK